MLGHTLAKTLESTYNIIAIDKEECDIADKEAVKKIVKGLYVDAVVHCAAYTDVDRAEDEPQKAFLINAQGTKNFIDNIENKNCLFVYLSTDYVFDGQKPKAYTETDIPHPLGVYGASKLEGELLSCRFEKHLVIRTSWLFGPGGKNFVTTIMRLAKEGQKLCVVSDQVGSPTYTLDLSRAIKGVLDIYFSRGLACGIYNITNSGCCSWYEFAQHIIKLAHLTTKVAAITSSQAQRKAKRPKNSTLSNEKFYLLTGYALPPWQEALKHYLDNNILS